MQYTSSVQLHEGPGDGVLADGGYGGGVVDTGPAPQCPDTLEEGDG